METEAQPPPPVAAISTDAVQILRRHTGRGPVKARTYINGDLVTIVLGDTLTTAERTLVANGEWKQVEGLRLTMQSIMEGDMTEAVEKHMGRKVVAFLSANSREPDLAIESFVLAPE